MSLEGLKEKAFEEKKIAFKKAKEATIEKAEKDALEKADKIAKREWIIRYPIN